MATDPKNEPHDPWAWIESHALEHSSLLEAHIDLTYRCDLACVHCYLEERVKHELKTHELVDAINDLADLGCMVILFSGGDIFLRPDALDILRAACDRQMCVHMITHAGHITEEIADELAQMGVAQVKVSIYSSRPEVHDAVTKLPGSLHKSLRAIHMLRARGVLVEMKCPVFEVNRGAQLEIPLLAAKYDCTYTLDHQIRAPQGTQGEAGNLPPLGLKGSCHDLSGASDLRSLNMDIASKVDVVRAKYPEFASLEALPKKSPTSPTCGAGRTSLYIDPEGKVFPCLEWEEECGDLRTQSLREVWESAAVFQKARSMTRGSFSGCSSCENATFCLMCPGQAHRESGDATGISPSVCRDTTATRIAFSQKGSQGYCVALEDWISDDLGGLGAW